jgi:MFS family permease
LHENWQQFVLLLLVNAFVGGMVGIERTVVPLLAESSFGRTSAAIALSFIGSFGAAKAAANLIAGHASDISGRKPVLIAGWLFALPVPIIIMVAPSWGWVVFANVLLGINQGLCWSTTVIMKIDLVGPNRRGFAMGLNEAVGYLAVAAAALGSGWLGATYGLRPEPFVLGLVFAVCGLLVSLIRVRETRPHAIFEATLHRVETAASIPPTFRQVFALTSWRDRRLFSVSQAGFINNLNDGMAWGLLPIFLAARGLDLHQIGLVAAVYPGTWGVMQLFMGAWSDRVGRKRLIAAGMGLQGVAILTIIAIDGFGQWMLAAAVLGVGTAMVYPTLLAAIGDVAHPSWRASTVGIYRLWRDLGYVAGAVIAGIVADVLGIRWAIGVVGGLTIASGVVVAMVMSETLPSRRSSLKDVEAAWRTSAS